MSKKNSSQSQTNDLAVLVNRLQDYSDQVEKNILYAEELLNEDSENAKRGLSLTRRMDTADNLAEAETLLKQLFMDVDKVKKLQHPQTAEIEQDVSILHDRWSNNCRRYRDLYKQGLELDLSPQFNWTQLLATKQKQILKEEYGPKLADVEKQIAAHNILHKEIQAYRSQVDSKEMNQYTRLEEDSQSRKKNLSSLYDYILRCDKEISYLTEQQDRIHKIDWSDLIRDSAGLRSDSERMKSNGILTHKSEVTKLQHEAEGLVGTNHPGFQTIKKHSAEVQKEWQRFLNLCTCQETHLNNVDIYKKFQLDAETVSESLKRVNSTMEPSLLSNMSNSQILIQLEGEERAVQRNERRLGELKALCTKVPPLPLRRAQYGNFPVVALCDWNTDKASVNRGDKYTLVSSPRDEPWEVKNSLGERKGIPGVCFVIPPPDTEAIERVESLEQDFAGMKRRRASLLASVKTPNTEVVKTVRSVSVSSSSEDSRPGALSNRLDRLHADLLQLEKEVLGRLRTPLSAADHTGDLDARIRDHERAVTTLRKLAAEKASIQSEIEPLLSSKSLGPTTVSYPAKLSTATNKLEDLNALTNLYGKKTSAVKSLENQIKNVSTALIELEKQLARDTVILDKPNALQDHIHMLKNIENNVEAKQEPIQKLNQDLELTEQLCGHLQKSFQEYCPDIRRQEKEVQNLRNRYANINNQLQQRMELMQEVTNKYQGFKSSARSLNAFLKDLPNNKILPVDTTTQITAKQNSQKWVVEELKRKSDDVSRTLSLSHELQSILKEYEAITYMNRNTVVNDETDMKKWQSDTFDDAIQNKERSVVKQYHELLAENSQLLDQMGLAKNIINKNEVIVSKAAVYQQTEMEDAANLKKELADEIARRIHAENELDSFRIRLLSLKNRRGVERVEEKETVHYYRNPQLEADLVIIKRKIEEEISKHSVTHAEIEIVNKQIMSMEHVNIKPKLLTKVMTEYSRDPQLEREATFIREEMQKIREEMRIRETKLMQMSTEITILEKKAPTVKQRVLKKEVMKIEKDPEMLRAVIRFKEEISDIGLSCKTLNEEIFQLRSKINALEIMLPNIQPQIIIKEVRKVEQDPELIKETKVLRSGLEEISQEIIILRKEISTLQVRFSQVEMVKQRIEVRELVNEVYRVDPDTETEIRRLRKEIQEWMTKRTEMEKKITVIMVDLKSLHSQKPRVEVKESVQEIIKEERSPEIINEITRLNEHLTRLLATYQTTLDKLTVLRKERDVLKVEKSKVEVKVVTKELVRYESDPLLEKEAERLRKELNEERQFYHIVEETLYDLRQKYIVLEKQKVEEKIIYQEVTRLQKDPTQIIEHERLKKRLEQESKSRSELEVEVKKWRAIILEKENSVAQTDIRQKKILVETELRQIRTHILEFENAPPPEEKVIIEEVIKIERDAKMDKLINQLRINIEEESARVVAMERDIRNLKLKIDVLTKEKSVEKTVYKEVIRLEKDQTVEAERDRLRAQLTQLKSAIRTQEEEFQRINIKVTRFQTSVTNFSKEETTLISNRNTLRKDREELLRELKKLESERQDISIKFQNETKIVSEKTQAYKQRLLKMEAELQSLELSIHLEKERIQQKESVITELQASLKKEDRADMHRQETTKTTKITILDPETGKDMSPYDAYMQGFIDRDQYIHLQTLECSWEEMTSRGPNGETSILQDRKSGKSYSIQEALTEGRLTQYELQQYKDGKIPISEFALKVAGEQNLSAVTVPVKPMSSSNSSSAVNSYSSSTRKSSLSSSMSNLNTATIVDETFPISGVLDTTTKSRMSVRSAMTRKLIDPDTAQKLLEAQAATGGIVDISKKERFSVHKAAERGLIEKSQMTKLLTAQKAFTGVEDPVTKGRLSAGEAAQKGLIPNENARRFMEAQLLTGGLVDPNKAGRISLQNAINVNMVDQKTAREIEDDDKMLKDLINPVTKSKMTYKEAIALCKKDQSTGLLLLPAASTDVADSMSFSSYRVTSTLIH